MLWLHDGGDTDIIISVYNLHVHMLWLHDGGDTDNVMCIIYMYMLYSYMMAVSGLQGIHEWLIM